MNQRWLNVLLAVALVALLAANLVLGSRAPVRNVEFMPTMVHSVPYDAFSAHPDLPGGMAMQSPPVGTIARGRMPLGFGPGPEEAVRAGAELTNPVPPSPESVERGQELFAIYCELCHGPGGLGNGTVAQRGFPAPPAFDSETSSALLDGQVFHIVTFGQNNMPGHASQIEPKGRWQVVQYVRQLQSQLNPAVPSASESQTAGSAGLDAIDSPVAVEGALEAVEEGDVP